MISGHLAWLEDSLGLGYLLGGLERGVALVRSVKHAEEVVVGASHDARVIPTPTALKLVEDAVILVQRTQLRPARVQCQFGNNSQCIIVDYLIRDYVEFQ